MSNDKVFGFWDKIKYLVQRPRVFFSKVKHESGIQTSLVIYVSIAIFVTVMKFFHNIGALFLFNDLVYIGYHSFVWNIIGFFTLILFTFIYSGLMYVFVISFEPKNQFKDTFNVYAYGMIPYTILTIIPYIGYISIIYSAILMVIGIKEVHKIETWKSILICLLPLVIFIATLIFLGTVILPIF